MCPQWKTALVPPQPAEKKEKTGQEHLAPKSSVNLLWKYHVLQSDLSIVQLKMTGSVNKALEDLLKLPTWFYMNLRSLQLLEH